MNAAIWTVQGTLKPDGSLELDEKVPLPVGRVKVTVQMEPMKVTKETLLERMEKIWTNQQARGFVPRTVEEVESERITMRTED
jgi:hypothetical protein